MEVARPGFPGALASAESGVASLAGADARGIAERHHEDLAVTDPAGAGAGHNRRYYLFDFLGFVVP